jgi:uncharacterized membrane protein YhaH (DUF805 family)
LFNILATRINRRTYWLTVGTILLLIYGLPLVIKIRIPAAGLLIAWLVAYVPRLHDFGKSGWFAVGCTVLSAAPLLIAWAIIGPDLIPILRGGDDMLKLAESSFWTGIAAVFASSLIQIAFTIWVGVRRGDPAENRFGPRPTTWGLRPR